MKIADNHIANQIMKILKDKSQQEHDYINPHFLVQLQSALYDYYELEDDEVDDWIQDMWGA